VSRGRHLVAGWTLAMAAMVLFASLARWQYGRMHEKQAMLDAVQRTLDARRPQPLALAADPTRAKTYDWAAGTGTFADAPAVLLDNQQRDGRPGVRVYRLFVADAAPTPLLVELGWLPLGGARALPVVPRPEGHMRIEGLLAPPPSGGIVRADAAPQPDGTLLVVGMDPAALARRFDRAALAPRVLKLDPRAPLGYARDLDVLPNTLPPAKHLGYAVQWSALALAVLATALILTFRKAKR
jgi:cytochrome oxidase assembly protein ShyY1